MIQVATEDSHLKILTSTKGKTYSLNQDVFLFLQDDIAQILDFQHGQFYGLDPIGTLMLSLVLEKSLEETVKYISKTYDATEDKIRSDLAQLLRNLEQKKLIISHGIESNRLTNWFSDQNQKVSKLFDTLLLWFLKRVSTIIHLLLDNKQNPSRQTVELLLIFSWISFRMLGWSRTISLWQHWHPHLEKRENSLQGEVIEKVDQMVREAAARQLFSQ